MSPHGCDYYNQNSKKLTAMKKNQRKTLSYVNEKKNNPIENIRNSMDAALIIPF